MNRLDRLMADLGYYDDSIQRQQLAQANYTSPEDDSWDIGWKGGILDGWLVIRAPQDSIAQYPLQAFSGFFSSAGSVLEGVGGYTGITPLQEFGHTLVQRQEAGNQYGPDAPSIMDDTVGYILSPKGFARDFGGLAGSMAISAPVGGFTGGLAKLGVGGLARVGAVEGTSFLASKAPSLAGAIGAGFIDAGSEAGSTYLQALDNGNSKDIARQKADQVFAENIGLSTVTEGLNLRMLGKAGRALGLGDATDDAGAGLLGAIANFGDKVGASKVADALRKTDNFMDNHYLTRLSGNIMTTTVPEAYQEGLQNEFQNNALTGVDINFAPWNMSPESQEQMAISALGMGPLAGFGSVRGRRKKGELPDVGELPDTSVNTNEAQVPTTPVGENNQAVMQDELTPDEISTIENQAAMDTEQTGTPSLTETQFTNNLLDIQNNLGDYEKAENDFYSNGDSNSYAYDQALTRAVLDSLDYNPVTGRQLTKGNEADLAQRIIESNQFPTITTQEDIQPVINIIRQRNADLASRNQAKALLQQMNDIGLTPQQNWVENANKIHPDSNLLEQQKEAISARVQENKKNKEQNIAQATNLIAQDLEKNGVNSDFYQNKDVPMSDNGVTRMQNFGVSMDDKQIKAAVIKGSRAAYETHQKQREQVVGAARFKVIESFKKEGINSPYYTPTGKYGDLKANVRKQLSDELGGEMDPRIITPIEKLSRKFTKQYARSKARREKQARVEAKTGKLVAQIRAFNQQESYGVTADENEIISIGKPSEQARRLNTISNERKRRAQQVKTDIKEYGLVKGAREKLSDIQIENDPVVQTVSSYAKDPEAAVHAMHALRNQYTNYRSLGKAIDAFVAKFPVSRKEAARKAAIRYINEKVSGTENVERHINDIKAAMETKQVPVATQTVDKTQAEPSKSTVTIITKPAVQEQEAPTQKIQEVPKTPKQESPKQGKSQKSNQKQTEAIPSEWNTSKDIPQEAKTIMETGTDDQKAALANRYRKALSGGRTGTRSNIGVWLNPQGHQNLEAQAQTLFPGDENLQKEIGKINKKGAARAIKKIQEAREKGEQIQGFTPEEISTIEKNAKTYLMRPQMINQLKGITGRSKDPSTVGFWLDPEKYQDLKKQAEKLFDRNDPANKPIFEEVDKNLLTKKSAEGILARIEQNKGKLKGYTQDEVETIKKNAKKILNKSAELINAKKDKDGNYKGVLTGLDTTPMENLKGDDLIDYLSYDAGLDKAGINIDIYEAKKLDNGDVEITYGKPYNESEKESFNRKTTVGGSRNEIQQQTNIQNIPQQSVGPDEQGRILEDGPRSGENVQSNQPVADRGRWNGSLRGIPEKKSNNKRRGPGHTGKTDEENGGKELKKGSREIKADIRILQGKNGETLPIEKFNKIFVPSFRGIDSETILKVLSYLKKAKVKFIYQDEEVKIGDSRLEGSYNPMFGNINVLGMPANGDRGRTALHEATHALIETATVEDSELKQVRDPGKKENDGETFWAWYPKAEKEKVDPIQHLFGDSPKRKNIYNLTNYAFDEITKKIEEIGEIRGEPIEHTPETFKAALNWYQQVEGDDLNDVLARISYDSVDYGSPVLFYKFFSYAIKNARIDPNARLVLEKLYEPDGAAVHEMLVATNILEINHFGSYKFLDHLLEEATDKRARKLARVQRILRKQYGMETNADLLALSTQQAKDGKKIGEVHDKITSYEEKTPKEAAEQQIKDAGIKTPEQHMDEAWLYGKVAGLTGKELGPEAKKFGAFERGIEVTLQVFQKHFRQIMPIYHLAMDAKRDLSRKLTEYNEALRKIWEPLNEAQRKAVERVVLFADAGIHRDPMQVIELSNGVHVALKYTGYYEEFHDSKEATMRIKELQESGEYRYVGSAVGKDGLGNRLIQVYGLDEGSKAYRSKASAEAFANQHWNETIQQALSEIDGKDYTIGQAAPVAKAFKQYRELMNKAEEDGYEANGKDVRGRHVMGYFPHIHLPYVVYQKDGENWKQVDSFHNISEAQRKAEQLREAGKETSVKEITPLQRAILSQYVGKEDLLTKKQLAELEANGGMTSVDDFGAGNHNKAIKNLVSLIFKDGETAIPIKNVLKNIHNIQSSKSDARNVKVAQIQIKSTGIVKRLQKLGKDTITKDELNHILNTANMHYRFNPHFLQRVGSEGYSKNVREATYQYLTTMANYVAKERFYEEATASYTDMFHVDFDSEPRTEKQKWLKDWINGEARPNSVTPVDNWINEFLRDTLSGGKDKWNKSFGKLPFIPQLSLTVGANPYFNFARNVMMSHNYFKLGLFNFSTAPVQLGALLNTQAKIDGKYFWRGMNAAFHHPDKSKRQYKELFDYLDIGSDYQSLDTELIGKTPDYIEKKIIAGKSIKDMADKSMMFFKWGDRKAREATAIAGYLRATEKFDKWSSEDKKKALDIYTRKWENARSTAKARGRKFTAPKPTLESVKKELIFQDVRDFVTATQFDYSSTNAPMALRKAGVTGRLLLQFRKYPLYMGNLIYHMSWKERAKLVVPLVLLAGTASIPGEEPMDEAIQFATQLFKEGGWSPSDELKKGLLLWAGTDPSRKAMANSIIYGLPAGTLGIDISRRIGLADMVPSEATSDLLGPTIGGIANIMRGKGVVRTISPRANSIADAINGEYTNTKGEKTVKYNTAERIWKFLGFKPISETNASDAQYIIGKYKNQYNKEKQKARQEYLDNPTPDTYDALRVYGMTDKEIKAMVKQAKKEKAKSKTAKGLRTKPRNEQDRELLRLSEAAYSYIDEE